MYSIKLAIYFDVWTPQLPHTKCVTRHCAPHTHTHTACFAIRLTVKSSTSDLHSNEATGEANTIAIPFLHSNFVANVSRQLQ
jgi:hypothetical protein